MSRTTGILMLAFLALLAHSPASAQEGRISVGVDVGAGTTWDDEGMLGRGAAIAGHVAVSLTDRVTIRGVYDRVPYYRDTSWLRFDGRFDFMGAEVERRFGRGTAQPFVSGGAGIVTFSDTWLHKNSGGPLAPSLAGTTSSRSGTYGAVVAGSGVDIALSPSMSLRPHVRIYMMGPDSDLHPALSLRPGVGLTMRW